jgi:hypothetical protein
MRYKVKRREWVGKEELIEERMEGEKSIKRKCEREVLGEDKRWWERGKLRIEREYRGGRGE